MTGVCTRFIADLSVEDQEFLVVSWRTHGAHAVRVRSHAILLSAKGMSVPQLEEIFSVDDNTVRSWLDRCDGQGRDGLEDLPRPGGPFKLDESQRQMTIDLLHEHPNNPKVVIDQVTKRWKDVKYTELPISAWQSLKSLIDGLTTTFKKLGRIVLLPSLAYG